MNSDLRIATSPSRHQKVGPFERTRWVFLVIAGVAVQPTALPAREAVTNISLAAKVADGRPWAMRASDGRKTTLTLFADGTGTMTGGPMPLSPKWRPTADGMCLKPAALMPERCVVLVPTNTGFSGSKDGTLVFTLER